MAKSMGDGEWVLNAQILAYESLEYLPEAHLVIRGKTIEEVREGFEGGGIDYKNCLIIPALFNAHTHLGDSFAQEAALGLSLEEAVGKDGLKWELYQQVESRVQVRAMKESLRYMLTTGITGFADFREGGKEGVKRLLLALKNLPLRAYILGRELALHDMDMVHGLGLNLEHLIDKESPPSAKFLAIHAGEAKEGEVKLALKFRPNLIVHATHVTEEEIEEIASTKTPVVVCPRANALLRSGFPPVRKLLDAGVKVALGTDNVMLSQPNLWRELEFTSKVSHLLHQPLTPKELLTMVTTTPSQIFSTNGGVIAEGKFADFIVLNLNAPNLHYTKNIHATLVHRVERANIMEVWVEGEVKYSKKEGVNQHETICYT